MSELLNPGQLPTAGDERNAEFVALSFLVRFSNKATRDSYGRSLRDWYAWCFEHGIDPLDAKRVHIEAWCRHLEVNVGNQKATVGSKLHALAGLYKFATVDGVIDIDPMAHVERPKIQRQSTTNTIERGEMLAIYRAAERHSARAHALVALLGLNGLRISEALGIQIGDFGQSQGLMTLFVRRRKNDKTQTISLSQLTAWPVQTYIGARTTGHLFTTSSGKQMTRQQADKIVKKLAAEVGIERRISPHSFRHAFCTLSHAAGVSERNIQQSGGWSDLRMVSYYDHGGGSLYSQATHKLSAFIAELG